MACFCSGTGPFISISDDSAVIKHLRHWGRILGGWSMTFLWVVCRGEVLPSPERACQSWGDVLILPKGFYKTLPTPSRRALVYCTTPWCDCKPQLPWSNHGLHGHARNSCKKWSLPFKSLCTFIVSIQSSMRTFWRFHTHLFIWPLYPWLNL